MRVSVVGDVRTRTARPHWCPCQRGHARAQCGCAAAVTGLERRDCGRLRLRRMAARVAMRTGTGPVRISRTHLLLGTMAAHFFRSGLPSRLHEDPHRAALQQQGSGQDEGQPLPPPGVLEWTSGDCHGPNARQFRFPCRHRGSPFTGGRPVTFFLDGSGTVIYVDFQRLPRRSLRACS